MTGRPLAQRRPGAAEVLRAKLAQTEPAVAAVTAELWRSSGLDRRYPDYLRAMYGVVRASVPLMERALLRCDAIGDGDSVCGPLRGYLEQHITEEQGHDEWLLADLAAVGGGPAGPPSPAVARLVGAQYYWIEHHHPVALLGYLAVMEGYAPAPWLPGKITAATGVHAAAVRTVREHAALDGDHADAVFRLLDAVPLTRDQELGVAVSGLHTVAAVLGLFAHVIEASRVEGGTA